MEDESHHNTSSSSVKKKNNNNNNRKRSRSSSRSRRKNKNSSSSVDAKPKCNQQQKSKKNPLSSSFEQKNNHRKQSRSRPRKKTNGSNNNSNFAEKQQQQQQQQQQEDDQDLPEEEEEEGRGAMNRPQSPISNNNVDDFGKKSSQQRREEEESVSASLYLRWDSPADLVPLHEEEAMMNMVLERHGKSERGMLKDKPPFVITKFRKQLSQKAPTMTMAQLCSLRRHHIKRLNFYKRMPELRLGQETDILKSAKIFEDVIETFLNNQQVEYWSEKEQGKIASSEKRPTIATPDFLLKKPVVLQKTRRKYDNGNGENRNRNRSHRYDPHGHGGNNRSNSNQHQQNRPLKKEQEQEVVVLEGQTIHWIEAKMFYGASTIPRGKKGGAVGQVLDKAQKYVDMFGTGAIVFMMGCGQVLGDQLREIGVTVVDCSSHEDFDLRPVHDHQRTWCANDKGEILP